MSGRVESALASAENLINAVDPEKIDRILANVDTATSEVAAASGNITETLESFSQAAQSLETLASTAGASLEKVDTIIAGIDPAKAGQAIDDIAAASADCTGSAGRSARRSRDPFSARKQDYDLIISGRSKQMTSTLNAASTRVDGVLAKVDGFLGEGDALLTCLPMRRRRSSPSGMWPTRSIRGSGRSQTICSAFRAPA